MNLQGFLTGKGASFGGSLIRPEATGYGVVYFTEQMLMYKKNSLKGKKNYYFRLWKCCAICNRKMYSIGCLKYLRCQTLPAT